MAGLPTLVLARTTTLSISDNTHTAVTFDSQVRNTGPSSWWSAGTPTQIVMPYAGPYLMTASATFSESGTFNGASQRAIHLNQTTSVSTSNFVCGKGIVPVLNDEGSQYVQLATTFNVASAGDVYLFTVYSKNTDNTSINLVTIFGTIYPVYVSFTFLGDGG